MENRVKKALKAKECKSEYKRASARRMDEVISVRELFFFSSSLSFPGGYYPSLASRRSLDL